MLGWKDTLFPGSPDIKYIGKDNLINSTTSTQKLADLLVTSSQDFITFQEIQDKCGIHKRKISQALKSKTVKPILTAGGWIKKKVSEVLGSGRGLLLVRIN